MVRAFGVAAVVLALPKGHAGQIPSLPSRVVATVYGAAGEVAGSMSVLDTGNARWMIDCGALAPEREGEKEKRPEPLAQQSTLLPVDGRSIAAVFLTHAHTDHVGRLPLLVEGGFRGPIYLTDATAELLPLMLCMQVRYDEGRLRSWAWSKQAYERAWGGERPMTVHWHADCPYRSAIAQENLQSARLSFDQLAARFEREDRAVEAILCRRCGDAEVAAIVALCRRVGYGKPMDVASGVSVTLLYAGHIPGSASVLLEVRVGDKKRRVLFSGDVGNDLSPLFPGPRPAPDVDAVFIETTYGPTFRDPSVQEERAQFRRSVATVVDLVAGGTSQECRIAQESTPSLSASHHQRDARQRHIANAHKPARPGERHDGFSGWLPRPREPGRNVDEGRGTAARAQLAQVGRNLLDFCRIFEGNST